MSFQDIPENTTVTFDLIGFSIVTKQPVCWMQWVHRKYSAKTGNKRDTFSNITLYRYMNSNEEKS